MVDDEERNNQCNIYEGCDDSDRQRCEGNRVMKDVLHCWCRQARGLCCDEDLHAETRLTNVVNSKDDELRIFQSQGFSRQRIGCRLSVVGIISS